MNITQSQINLRVLRGQTLTAAETRSLGNRLRRVASDTPPSPPWWDSLAPSGGTLDSLNQALALLERVGPNPEPMITLVQLASEEDDPGLLSEREKQELNAAFLSQEHLALCGALVLGHYAVMDWTLDSPERPETSEVLRKWSEITARAEQEEAGDLTSLMGWLTGYYWKTQLTLALGQGRASEQIRTLILNPYFDAYEPAPDEWRRVIADLAWQSGNRSLIALASPIHFTQEHAAARVRHSDTGSLRLALDELWSDLRDRRADQQVHNLKELAQSLFTPHLPREQICSLEDYLLVCDALLLMQLTPEGLAWTGLNAPQNALLAAGNYWEANVLRSELQLSETLRQLASGQEPWTPALRRVVNHLESRQHGEATRWIQAQNWQD